MKIFTRLLPALTAGTFLAAAGALHAQAPAPSPATSPAKEFHHGPPEHREMGDPMELLKKKLNLSSEQEAQIKPIVEAALPVFKKIHDEEKAKMEGAMEVAVSEVKAELNPEQKEGLDRLLAQMHEMHDMHGPGMHGHDGPGHDWHPSADHKPAAAPSATGSPAAP